MVSAAGIIAVACAGLRKKVSKDQLEAMEDSGLVEHDSESGMHRLTYRGEIAWLNLLNQRLVLNRDPRGSLLWVPQGEPGA